MGSKRRRRLPVTSETSDNARASTRSRSSSLKGSPKAQTTRGLIRRFHVLLKQRSKLLENQEESKVYSTKERNQSKTNETQATDLKNQRLEHIDAEISEMGGLEVYQMMSAAGQLGERGGGSEKVLIGWMKELDLHNRPTPPFRKGKEEKMGNHVPPKMRLLEVGALLPDNYKSCSRWLESCPIDLRSRHPSIKEQDFFLIDEVQERGKWDVISLSLVLNFVATPKERGRMLQVAHSLLKTGTGLLFVVLPLPCILNSRYLDHELFQSLLTAIGFTLMKERWKEGGKVGYWLYRAEERNKVNSNNPQNFLKKRIVREGEARNNFAILL